MIAFQMSDMACARNAGAVARALKSILIGPTPHQREIHDMDKIEAPGPRP